MLYDYFFLLGRCVKAEPAAVLAFLSALEFFKVFEAAVPAFLPVTSELPFLFLVIDVTLLKIINNTLSAALKRQNHGLTV